MPEPLLEREFVSQFATPTLGIIIHRDGVPGDADANTVTVTMQTQPPEGEVVETIFTRQAEHPAVGTYQTTLSSIETQEPGQYKISWSYSIDGAPQIDETYIEIGSTAPAYDALSPELKQVVDTTWMRFADGFDSASGGPHLQSYFQSHFGRNRIAQLLRIAVGYLNTSAQPFQTYTIDAEGKPFPVAKWGALLEFALYLEVLRHLRRSYVEQPNSELANVARLDRRDYYARWGEILRDEEPRLESQMEVFKISHMGLGAPSVLVAGGIYPNMSMPHRAYPARPRYWARFY